MYLGYEPIITNDNFTTIERYKQFKKKFPLFYSAPGTNAIEIFYTMIKVNTIAINVRHIDRLKDNPYSL